MSIEVPGGCDHGDVLQQQLEEGQRECGVSCGCALGTNLYSVARCVSVNGYWSKRTAAHFDEGAKTKKGEKKKRNGKPNHADGHADDRRKPATESSCTTGDMGEFLYILCGCHDVLLLEWV